MDGVCRPGMGSVRAFSAKMYKITKVVQMQTVALSEFRANASAMIDVVEQGETVRILRHGKLVAEVTPPKLDAPVQVPHWKLPIKPLTYLRKPEKTGAQMIIEERESGW